MPDENRRQQKSTNGGDDINVGNIDNSQAIAIGHGATAIIGVPIEDFEHLPPKAGDPPYKGLRYFDEKDADWFFGRERVTTVLINRLHETDFLAVVGDSGSGKSSVIRAGVVPAMKRARPLADGSVPPLGAWQVKVMTPTARPLEKLADTLFPDDNARQASVYGHLATDTNALCDNLADQLTPEQPLLLVIDQFEELFSQCKDEAQRGAFIANVVAAAQPTCKIILTLRADFYASCLRYEPLRRILKESQEPLGPMSGEELRAVILEPAAKGKWKVQEGLTEQMLEDVGQEPGALPLLSHALRGTWERRRGRVLTLSGYRAAGGVKGAITQTAERVYQSLTSEEQAITQQIFLRLTELGEGTQDTRRRLERAELHNDPLTVQVTKKLADARLITTTESGMEVTHEAVIREWPRLREWLDTDREGLMIRRRLTNAAQDWQNNNRDASLLFRGLRLAEVEAWSQSNDDKLNEQERKFLETSIAEFERQEAAEEQQRRNEAELYVQREVKKRMQASQLAFAAKAEMARDPERALLLAIAGLGIKIQPNTHLVLADSLQSHYRTTLYGHEGGIASAVFSPDGQTILTAGCDEQVTTDYCTSTARLWDKRGNELVVLRGHGNVIWSVAFSPDGQTILTASEDGTARLWDRQGNELSILRGHEKGVNSAIFSPDGQTILTASHFDDMVRLWDKQGNELVVLHGNEYAVTSAVFSPNGQTILTVGFGLDEVEGFNYINHTARLWDLQGKELAVLGGRDDEVSSAVFSLDGQTILTASEDGTARLWDLHGNELAVLHGHKYVISSAVFSPDGQTILTSGDGTARLWDRQGNVLTILRGREKDINSAVFGPDGQTILTAGSSDGTAHLWDKQGNELTILSGHGDRIISAVFSSDGQTILTISEDLTARLWDVQRKELIILTGHKYPVYSAVFSPDGQTILTASRDKTARLWDRRGEELVALRGHGDDVNSAVFSPDGQTILTASDDLTARLWDRKGDELAVLHGNYYPVTSAVFSPDGQNILTASSYGLARLWDRQGNELTVLSVHGDRTSSAVFSPDGQTILTAGSSDGTAHLWDKQGNELTILSGHGDRIISAVFSPDGQTILTASSDNTARLWDRQGNELTVLSVHGDRVLTAVFSPNGQTILTASSDNTARLWDRQGNELAVLNGHGGYVYSATFSSDGQTILTASEDHTVRLWPTLEYMVQEAFGRLKRGFTEEECQQFFRDDPAACPRSKKALFEPLVAYLSPEQQAEWTGLKE